MPSKTIRDSLVNLSFQITNLLPNELDGPLIDSALEDIEAFTAANTVAAQIRELELYFGTNEMAWNDYARRRFKTLKSQLQALSEEDKTDE